MPPHKNISMSFDDLRIIHLFFSTNENYKKRKIVPISTQISGAHKYNKKKKTLTIRLKVVSTEGNFPFSFEVESEGNFSFTEKPDEETLESFAKINCAAIMFPYIRETIADMTRRAGFNPLHLPPVNFVAMAENSKNTKKSVKKLKTKKTVKKPATKVKKK